MTRIPLSPGRALQAVLIDMDGTLLDSERVWDVALEDLAAWLGGSLSDDARREMVGSSIGRSVAIVHDDLGIDADPAVSTAYLSAGATQLFRTSLSWQPGARELLLALRIERVPVCLVTSTQRRMTEIALDFMGRAFFDASVCGDEVEHNKPHPDPYLRAATLLDVSPQDCVVIEDSPTGTASGQAAGCVVVAVPNEVPIEPAPRRLIVRSLTELSVDRLRALVAGEREPTPR